MKNIKSELVAGTMNWGIWGRDLNSVQMSELIETYVQNGIAVFDHADIYGNHTTEAAFGEAFKQSGVDREKVRFISKCGIKYPSENRNYSLKHYDYTEEHIRFSVENSLRNLQTDYLDVLLLHRPSPLMDPREIAYAVKILQNQGKIKAVGVSNFTVSQMELMESQLKVEYNQIQFSLTHHQAMLDGTLDFMRLHRIQPMAWNPLGSVFKEQTAQTDRIMRVLLGLTQKYNVEADVILLAWIRKHPAQIQPVLGTADIEKVKRITSHPIPDLEQEDWFALWEASLGHKVP